MEISFYTLGIFAASLVTEGAVPCILLCILQYFLSKKENPWLGRILPIVSAAGSLFAIRKNVFFLVTGNAVSVPQAVANTVTIFLICNIPTLLFVVIHRVVHKRSADKRDMERMNIQDLE